MSLSLPFCLIGTLDNREAGTIESARDEFNMTGA